MPDPTEIPYYFEPGDELRSFPICNKTVGKNQTVFVSEDALEKYRGFKDYKKAALNQEHLSDLQAQGTGMPLFLTDAKYFQKFGGKVLTVNQCHPPKRGALFDKSDPTTKVCEVKVSYKSRYKRYELDFPGLGLTVYFFMHFRFPFGDFVYKGKRYRWLRYSYNFSFRINDYSYTLYEIDPHQASLVDDVTPGNEVNKNSLLLGGRFKTFFLQGLGETTFEYNKFVSQRKRAMLEFLPYNNILGFGSLQKNCVLTMAVPQTENPESVINVNEDTIVFTSMACLLKLIEDYRTDKRQSS